jgi:magnesium transporter
MSSDVATLRTDQTVTQAMQHLRAMAEKKETIYYNYVIDSDGRLLGIVSLRDLVLASPDAMLEDVMNRDVIRVDVADSVDEVGRKIREYDLLALPVVDDRGRLAGIVTVDDVLDAAEAETTEDFNKLGATGLGRASYRDASPLLLYRRRIVWLLVLVFVNIFSGAGIAVFENTIAVVPALVIFLPLLIGSGGNAGSQSATLMVRALATGEADIRDWVRLLLKEILVALGLGLTMAAGVGLVSSVMAPQVLWAVVPSMVLLVMVGSLIGLLLPFVLTKLNMDPATASGPLITSLADISGVLIYFAVASYMLRDVLTAAAAAT